MGSRLMPFSAYIVTALCRCQPLPKLLSIACIFTLRQRRPLGGRLLYRAAHTGHLLAVETARSAWPLKAVAAAAQ